MWGCGSHRLQAVLFNGPGITKLSRARQCFIDSIPIVKKIKSFIKELPEQKA